MDQPTSGESDLSRSLATRVGGEGGTHKLFKMTASNQLFCMSLGTLGLASGPSGVYNPALKWSGEEQCA